MSSYSLEKPETNKVHNNESGNYAMENVGKLFLVWIIVKPVRVGDSSECYLRQGEISKGQPKSGRTWRLQGYK